MAGLAIHARRSIVARMLSLIEHPGALAMLRRAVEGGYYMYPFVVRDPWLDPLRGGSEFNEIVRLTESGYRNAAASFTAAGGEKLLGPAD